RILERGQRLLEIDDVDLVAMAVDVRGHLGVPEAGLVSEMDAGFQHFAHGYRHGVLQRLGLESRRTLHRVTGLTVSNRYDSCATRPQHLVCRVRVFGIGHFADPVFTGHRSRLLDPLAWPPRKTQRV